MQRDTNLHQLVINKDYQALLEALSPAVSGNTESRLDQLYQGSTLIHLAILAKDIRMIQILLAAGPSLDIKNADMKLPREICTTGEIKEIIEKAEIIVASWQGSLETVKNLVKMGRNPCASIKIRFLGRNMREQEKMTTALYCAQYKSHKDIISYLYPFEAAMSYKDRDFGLFEAIAENEIHAVRGLILHYKHDVNCYIFGGGMQAANYHGAGGTPLSYCVYKENVEIAKVLLELGADRDDEGAIDNIERIKSTALQEKFRELLGLPSVKKTTTESAPKNIELKPKPEAETKPQEVDIKSVPPTLMTAQFDGSSELYHRAKSFFSQEKEKKDKGDFFEVSIALNRVKDSLKLFRAYPLSTEQQGFVDKRLEKVKTKITECKTLMKKK